MHRVLRAILALADIPATVIAARGHRASDLAVPLALKAGKSAGRTERPRKAKKRIRHGSEEEPLATGAGFQPIPRRELDAIGEESSESERRAQDSERELIEWKKARFMRDKLGEEFDALVISVTKFGFFVELNDIFVEGLVPADWLDVRGYMFHEELHEWSRGKGGRGRKGSEGRARYRIGDRVKVTLDRLGDIGGKMSFSVVED